MFGWLRAHRRARYWEACWQQEHEEKGGLERHMEELRETLRYEREKLRLLHQEMAKLKGDKP